MASLRAHLFDLMVRYGVRRPLTRTTDIVGIRAVFGRTGFAPAAEAGFRPGCLGGVPGEHVALKGAGPAGEGSRGDERPLPRLLYLHGGGHVGCSPATHRPITGAFARAGFSVFAPDYRLAPEHPFPAAIEDALAVWRVFSRRPAAVAGDSAGGNLALALMLEARRLGLPRPAAAALFSPSCDYLGRGASYRENRRADAMFDPRTLLRLIPAYVGAADAADPLISPLNADLAGLPPLLVHVGAREMLRDDSIELAARARAAGVPVSLTVWPVVPHVWQLAESFLPEARASLDEAAGFLRRALAQAGESGPEAPCPEALCPEALCPAADRILTSAESSPSPG